MSDPAALLARLRLDEPGLRRVLQRRLARQHRAASSTRHRRVQQRQQDLVMADQLDALGAPAGSAR